MAMPPPPPPPMSQSRMEEGIRPGGPPPFAPKEVSGLVICLNVINAITHLLLGGVAFSSFFFINHWETVWELTAHVHMTVIGYVLLLSQGILAFNPHTGWASNLKHPQKRMAHWILQVLGSCLAISGGAIAIASTDNNLQSTHGIVGFVAMILTTVSLVGGIVHLVCPVKMNTVLCKTLHSCVGCLTITLAFTAICIAFDLIRDIISDINADLSIAITVFALVGTLLMAFPNMGKRLCD